MIEYKAPTKESFNAIIKNSDGKLKKILTFYNKNEGQMCCNEVNRLI